MYAMRHPKRHDQWKKIVTFSSSASGFTMLELVVCLAILAVFILLLLLNGGSQLGKSEDAKRKDDLAKMKIAFEDYYNDKGCYPPPQLLQNCGSSDMQPYLATVPCDPKTHLPYPYYRDNTCHWYGLFTTLANTKDPIVNKLGCSPTCGIADKPYNYSITNGSKPLASIVDDIGRGPYSDPNATPEPTAVPTAAPTPQSTTSSTASPAPGDYACDPLGQCNVYDAENRVFCPVTYADPVVCQQGCADLVNRCSR